MPQTPPSLRQGVAVGTFALVALVVALAVGGVWWVQQREEPSSPDASDSTASSSEDDDGDPTDESANEGAGDGHGDGDGDGDGQPGDGSDADPGLGEEAEQIAMQDFPDDPRLLVVSVDGLGSLWVSKSSTPTLADLLSQGAGTLNARTEVERTVTLPNHTSMVTGDRVAAVHGGHGVTWNHTSTRSVAPGTGSVFSRIAQAGGSSAVYAGKEKFEMWERAWPGTMEPFEIRDQSALVTDTITDLSEADHDLVFLHLAGPDSAGHKYGWGSTEYLAAVETADADINRVVTAIVADPELAEEVVVVVTADHGGVPGTRAHIDRSRPENYTIPFVVWGPGIATGDIYDLNPDYRDPGRGQPGYDGPQPVRNGDVANLVTDLLDLDAVPGSLIGAAQDLDVEE